MSIVAKLLYSQRSQANWAVRQTVFAFGSGRLSVMAANGLAKPEREVRELRQANEILKKASAYFAQAELDRPFRK